MATEGVVSLGLKNTITVKGFKILEGHYASMIK